MAPAPPSSVPSAHYRLRRSFHLGDCWARLNYALRLLEEGEEFSLHLPNLMTKEILALLDFGPLQPNVLGTKAVADDRSRKIIRRIDTDTAYRCTYFPTKQRHHGGVRAISISLDAQWKAEEKIPPGIDEVIGQLREALPEFDFIPVGQPHQTSLTEVVSILAKVRLHVSVDNGIAHIARSVGVPLYLLEHQLPLKRGFPPEASSYTLVTMKTIVAAVVSAVRSGDR